MGESTCKNDQNPVFSKDLCRRCYTADLAERKASGEAVTRGPAGRLPRVECSLPGCTNQVPIVKSREKAYAAGDPLYCSREHRKEGVGAKVTVTCSVCGKEQERYRSEVERATTGVFFCGPVCQGKSSSKPRRGTEEPCGACGKPVYRAPGDDAEVKYCDHTCRANGLRGRQLVERIERACEACGKVWELSLDQMRLDVRTCSRECTAANRRRKPGERSIDRDGYAWITAPDGRDMLEHRWVMEQAVGRRLLPTETVHHLKGGFKGRSNNALSNLQLWTGRHPKGHRVEDVVAYCREMLAVYGDEGERERYAELAAVVLADASPAAVDESEEKSA